MRGYRWLAALALCAGLAHAQTVGSLASSACPLAGCATSSGSGVSGLTSGRVTLSTGATSVGDDAGLTYSGTGATFKLGIGTDVFLSRASAGLLLVEDGSGNARDVRARTVFAGNGSAGTPAFGFSAHAGEGFYFDASSGLSIVSGGTTPLVAFSSGYPGSVMALNAVFSWGDSNARNPDLFLRKYAAATLQLGDIDAASPIAQTLQAQGSRATVDTNVAGANLTIRPGAGTGNATGSSLVFKTPSVGASGTTAQTQTTRLTVSEPAVIAAVPVRLAGYTVATLPAGTVGDTAYVTDATAPTYNGALTGGGAVTIPVFYNGAAWVSH